MKILILGIVVMLLGCAYPVSRVLVVPYPGEAVGNRYDTLDIRGVWAAWGSDAIVVKLRDRRKLMLDPQKIWGYQDRDSSLHRYYNRRFVSVKQLDTPTIYSIGHSSGKSTHTDYYFSKTPSAPIYALRWKNIKKEYADDSCFTGKLDRLGFFQAYEKYDRKRKSYRFVDLYKACKGKLVR